MERKSVTEVTIALTSSNQLWTGVHNISFITHFITVAGAIGQTIPIGYKQLRKLEERYPLAF